MRAADITTIFRTFLVILVLYLVIIKYDPVISVLLFLIATALDGIDGYLAIWQESNHKISFNTYLKAAISKNRIAKASISRYKNRASINAKFGPRIDVAADRVAEYAMFIIFLYLGIVPLYIVIAVVIIHSFADALMGSRGTSSEMKTKAAKLIYSSNASRALINVLKIVTFAYLIFEYVDNYPQIFGYILIAGLFIMILLRGVVEIYDSIT